MAIFRPNTRHVRHRSVGRLRYSDRLLAFLNVQATRLGYTVEHIFGTIMDRGGSADDVVGLTNAGPTNSVAPAITGTQTVGSTLTVSDGTWAGAGITYTRQWFIAHKPVAGATNATFVIPAGAKGQRVNAFVRATNSSGNRLRYAAAPTGIIP